MVSKSTNKPKVPSLLLFQSFRFDSNTTREHWGSILTYSFRIKHSRTVTIRGCRLFAQIRYHDAHLFDRRSGVDSLRLRHLGAPVESAAFGSTEEISPTVFCSPAIPCLVPKTHPTFARRATHPNVQKALHPFRR